MKKPVIEIFSADTQSRVLLPLADQGIKAGFPSPAQDYLDVSIDLNQELVRNPASTFYGRVRGDSLVEADIHDGDIVVIDKSLEPRQGDLAVCCIDGEFTLKYINIQKDGVYLQPANKDYEPIFVSPDDDFIIWGIVTYSIKKHRGPKRR